MEQKPKLELREKSKPEMYVREIPFHVVRLTTATETRARIQAAMSIENFLSVVNQLPFSNEQIATLSAIFRDEKDVALRSVVFSILSKISEYNEEVRELMQKERKPKLPKPEGVTNKIARSERGTLFEQLSSAPEYIHFLQEAFPEDKQLLFVSTDDYFLRNYDEALALCKVVETMIKELEITHVAIASSPRNSEQLQRYVSGEDHHYGFLSNLTQRVLDLSNKPNEARDITSTHGLVTERLHKLAEVFPLGIEPYVAPRSENAFDFYVQTLLKAIRHPKNRVLVVDAIAMLHSGGCARNDTSGFDPVGWQSYSIPREIDTIRDQEGLPPVTTSIIHRWRHKINFGPFASSALYNLPRDVGVDPKQTLLAKFQSHPTDSYETYGDYDGLIIVDEQYDENDDDEEPEPTPPPEIKEPTRSREKLVASK